MASKKRCQGRRRQWRRGILGNYACGRVATYVFETRVGLSRTHYTCGDRECMDGITSGYPAYNVRAVAA